MESLLILIIIFAAYIAFRLHKIFYLLSGKNKNEVPRTSLNPLYSDVDIANIDKVRQHYLRMIDTEHRVMRPFEEADKETGKPSEDLLQHLRAAMFYSIGADHLYKQRRGMIEANIAVINGKSMDKVQDEYGEKYIVLPMWENQLTYDKIFDRNLKPDIDEAVTEYISENFT